jgi:hypothetical protein
MDMPKPSDLSSAVNAFTGGNIEASATNLAGDSLSSLLSDKSDMFACVMDGKLSTSDVETICTKFALDVMTYLLPGNAMALVAAPVVGKALGQSVSQVVPTDMSLFPAPMTQPVTAKDASYTQVQSSLSNEMNSLKSSMNLDNVPDNIDELLGNLNIEEVTDVDAVDKQIKTLIDLVEDPMSVFAEKFPAVATLLSQFVPGLKDKADAAKKAMEETDNVKIQMKEEISKGIQKDKSMAASMKVIDNKTNASLPKAITDAIPPFRGYCDTKMETASETDKAYYLDMKNKVTNLDIAKLTSDTAADTAKKQISTLVKQQLVTDTGFSSLRNAWSEYRQNSILDGDKSKQEDYMATFGFEYDPLDRIKRTLTTNVKFMAKAVKIFNNAKTGKNTIQKATSQSLTAKISEQIPEMKPEELATLSKMISGQIPSQNQMLQESGVDNLQFTGEKILAQLNDLKSKLNMNGLA